jgi:hypothetical protein
VNRKTPSIGGKDFGKSHPLSAGGIFPPFFHLPIAKSSFLHYEKLIRLPPFSMSRPPRPQNWLDCPTWRIIVLFIALDLAATVLFLLHQGGTLESSFFRPSRDRGFFELIEYGKLSVIIYLLWRTWKDSGAPVIRAWVILFSVMLLDNALELHERLGGFLVEVVALPNIGLSRPKDLGEIIVLGLLEGSALLFVGVQYFRGTRRYRRYSLALVGLVLAIGTTAVIADALHLSVVEESLEIVGMTILLAFVHYKYRHPPPETLVPARAEAA